jgi:hypothetical protein
LVSPHARKLLCLAGVSWSFANAAAHLAEFCGLHTCDQTIRAVCHEEAGLVADWLHHDPAVGSSFQSVAGDSEFQTDGTMVNTWESWREMRLGIYAKRTRGRPATAEEWDTRRLSPPGTRLLFAGIETAEHFGPRMRRWAGRLGIRDAQAVTVLADGAEWIWNQAAVQLPGAGGLLDIYHAGEHLAACGHKLYGEGTAEAQQWLQQTRAALLVGGWPALVERTQAARRQVRSPRKRRALDELEGYFWRQRENLDYAGRLERGQSIGSGLVEGACKQVIGRRMKQTGARWRVRRANRMATLCCTFHGDTWKAYWEHRLN